MELDKLIGLNDDEFIKCMYDNFLKYINVDNDHRIIEIALKQRKIKEQVKINIMFHDLILKRLKEYRFENNN